jgi:ankyrin repeat protein
MVAGTVSDLMGAIAESDVATVRQIVVQDREVAKGDDAQRPLMSAAQSGEGEIVKILLEAGADPNAADDDGETALHVASFYGFAGIVEALLRKGAQADAGTELGKMPLMNAAQSGSVATVKLLLGAGATAVDQDVEGRSALHWAMVGDHDDASVLSVLLDAGADAAAKNRSGETALDYARTMKKLGLERRLMSEAK